MSDATRLAGEEGDEIAGEIAAKIAAGIMPTVNTEPASMFDLIPDMIQKRSATMPKGPTIPELKRRYLSMSRQYRHLMEAVQVEALTRAGLSEEDRDFAMQPLRSYHAMCEENDLEWLGVTAEQAREW